MTDYQLIQSIIQCGVNDDLDGAKKVLEDYVKEKSVILFDEYLDTTPDSLDIPRSFLRFDFEDYLQQKTPEHS